MYEIAAPDRLAYQPRTTYTFLSKQISTKQAEHPRNNHFGGATEIGKGKGFATVMEHV
jgi:hypothetical protein